MPSKIKSVLYCHNGNYLCVGLQNGQIYIYKIEVQNETKGKDDGWEKLNCKSVHMLIPSCS
jgi:hypothetical protein